MITKKYKTNPTRNIGFLPTTSDALGRIKDPTKAPIKKNDPMKLIAILDVQ